MQTETWRSGLTHPLAKRATPSRGSAGSNPAVSALEGDPAWRGNGLENREVRKGRGSTPPPSATVTMAAAPRHYRPPRGALLSLRQTRGVPRRRAACLRSFGERTSLRREDVAGVVILLAVSAPSGTDFVSAPGPRRGRAQAVSLPGQFARLCRGRGTSTGSNHARDVRRVVTRSRGPGRGSME